MHALYPCNLLYQQREKKNISLWKLECVTLQGVLQYTLLSTLLCLQMFIEMTHWSAIRPLWLLLLHQYWNLTGTPLRFPVLALCHGDLLILDL